MLARLRLPTSILRVTSVRARVFLVILIPLLVLIPDAGSRGWTLYHNASSLGQAANRAAALRRATTLTQALGDERDLTAGVLAARAVADRTSPAAQELQTLLPAARAHTNQAVEAFQKARARLGSGHTGDQFAAASQHLAGLPDLRQTSHPSGQQASHQGGLAASATWDSYTSLISNLLNLVPAAAPAGADEQLTTSTRALVDLSRLIETTSQLRGRLLTAAFAGQFDTAAAAQFARLRVTRDTDLAQFAADAPAGTRGDYDQTVAGLETLSATAIETGAAQNPLADLTIDPSQLWHADTAVLQLQGEVESRLTGSIVHHSNKLANHATQAFRLIAAGGLVVLLVAVAITWRIARGIVQALARIGAGARDVAHQLPRLIRRLEDGEPPTPQDKAAPLDIDTRDEIGQVAQAFNQVHAEAVRGAIEQAELRRNVAQMFTNLARRSQSLVDRQIQLIDQLEQTEDDPDRLSEMFKLDHLATRMRRNDENLLVLAGENNARRWSRPVSLVNVLRAAASEVEQYARVELTALENDLPISGHAVNDVVHLIAELLENATGYSSPRTKVLVSSRMVGPNLMVEIEDQGIGMAPQKLAAINERLSRPPTATEVDVSKHMGLYVVSQLAGRHRIKVQLRASPLGGVIAMILIPAACLRPQGDFQQGGDQQGYGQQQGQPAGAGQGFAQPRALTAQPTATPPPPRTPVPQRQPYASGSTRPVQFNTGSFPPAPAQYGTSSSTPPVPYVPGTRPPGAAPQSTHPAWPAPTAGYRLDGPGSHLLDSQQDSAHPPEPSWVASEPAPPLYAQVESEWFRDDPDLRDPTGQASTAQGDQTGRSVAGEVTPYAAPVWTTPADGGWQAADDAAEPRPAGVTGAGLPRRDPMAQLVPGAAEPLPLVQQDTTTLSPTRRPFTDADRHRTTQDAAQATRSLLSSYRDGIERGRAEGRSQSGRPQ
ncbi:MAG: nitrate- and nitrite sensing domain-containing protein [Mycobacteriales bacterium]